MTYDIAINARTSNGDRLNTVYLRNAPEDADKIIRIRESLMVNGWEGRAVVLVDCGCHHLALSGSHRLAAAQGMDGVIDAVMMPELSQDEWDLIEGAHDDDDLLRAVVEISETRDDMAEVVDAIRAEVAANNG